MTTATLKTIEKRVAKGATWLDKEHKGWWKKIRTTTLDMSDGSVCIVGQLNHGDYEPEDLGLKYTETSYSAHGFDVTRRVDKLGDEAETEYYEALDGLWKEQVRQRRAKAQA